MRRFFVAIAGAGAIALTGGLASVSAQTGYYPSPGYGAGAQAPSNGSLCTMSYPPRCADPSSATAAAPAYSDAPTNDAYGSSQYGYTLAPYPYPAYARSFPTTYLSPYYWSAGLTGYSAPAPSSLALLTGYASQLASGYGGLALASYPSWGGGYGATGFGSYAAPGNGANGFAGYPGYSYPAPSGYSVPISSSGYGYNAYPTAPSYPTASAGYATSGYQPGLGSSPCTTSSLLLPC